MQLTTSDIYTFHRPTLCPLRVYLREQKVPEAEPSAFEQVLRTLGERHERAHLKTLGAYEDFSAIPVEQRVSATKEAMDRGAAVIYQGQFASETTLDETLVKIIGRPDFLIWDRDGYVIRDSKLSLHIDAKHHVEISLQLQLYGWLYERTLGVPPKAIQVHTGKGDIIDVPYDGGVAALNLMLEIFRLKQLPEEPYEPLGWTKCAGGCGYDDYCWQRAEAAQDVSLVMEVDQGLARKLHQMGVQSAKQLLGAFDVGSLSELQRPWGQKQQKVGKKAQKILLYADVLTSGKERVLAPVAITPHESYVMFDFEGMPPHLDELDKIYLWGIQVYGKRPGPFIGVTAGFGADGDREGWTDFLNAAAKIFAEYGDVPFVHWHHYEKTHINQYIDRYGDRNGIAARVLKNLLDLLPVTKAAIALPLPSYSLKVVEQYVGFKRTQDEYGGDWAMAQFILATESEDEQERNARMAEILKYNEEDLAATWAVFEWLRSKAGKIATN